LDGWPTQACFWLEWGCPDVTDDDPADKLDCPHALGLTRFHQSGQSHFVTFCCYHRRRLLAIDESCRILESALERVRRSYRLYVYGYVVMPEHVHLLLSEPNCPTQAKIGLEWATRPAVPSKQKSPALPSGAHLSLTADS